MAFTRSAQRVYERSAIEAHFENFDFTWESKFSAAELEEGRKLYRNGAVRVLELHKNIAIICLKLEDETEPYSVIDFEGKKFSVRSLTAKDREVASFAVAGLYEIEELLADEVSPIILEKSQLENPKAEAESQEPKEEKVFEESMPLLLNFSLKKDALVFSTFWKKDKQQVPAFGKSALDAATLNASEREKLVRLASLARKAGFSYDKKNYSCSDTSKIPHFVNSTLKDWRRYFEIQKSDDLKLLSKGVQDLDIRADLFSDGDEYLQAKIYADIDGEKISFKELKRLRGYGGRSRIMPSRGLVRISDADEKLLASVEESFVHSGDKIPRYMMFTLFENIAGLKISADLKAWKESVFKEHKIPENLAFLREYQRVGVSRILSLFEGGCGLLLADEMGLGKTVQTLAAISQFWDEKESFLIVCPSSVIAVWKSEIEKFFPNMRAKVLDASSSFEGDEGTLWLSSYTQLRRNKSKLDGVKFKLAVLDEAQYIKNPDAKSSEACMAIRAEKKIALTGTPMENRLLDLWTIFRWLMPGLLGRRGAFEDRINQDANFIQTIKKQITPFVLRRLKDEVAKELPVKSILDLPCPLTPLQQSEYDKLLDNAKTLLRSGATAEASGRASILSLLMRLRQTACDPALLPWIGDCDTSNSGKINVIIEALKSIILSGRKAVIFSQFTSFIRRMHNALQKEFEGLQIFELTGATKDRAAPVDAFQKVKSAAVIFVSIRAGGTGITLTNADYVFLADPWWNPSVENQAIDRVHRIGRKNEVFVYRMIAGNTVEERVRKLQEKKTALFADIFASLSGGGISFEESIAEILDL